MPTQYVLQDRTLPTRWAVQIVGGVLSRTATTAVAQAEPELHDTQTDATWRLFVAEGIVGYELVLGPFLALTDPETAVTWHLRIVEGVLTWQAASS